MKRNSRIADDTTRRNLTDKARGLERRALVLDTIAEGKDDDPLPILDGEDMDAALDACVALTLGKQPPSGKALRRDAAEIRRLTDEDDAEKRPRYPKDGDALKVLHEAAKRKERGKYAGATDYAIALSLLLQENTDAYWKIMLRPKNKAVAAPPRKPTYNRSTSFVKKAAENWGKHISAYLKDHKDA